MKVNSAPQPLRLRLDVTRIFSGVAFVPEGQPMLARDFSPWDAHSAPARVPSGRLKPAPRRGSRKVAWRFNLCGELNVPLSSRAKVPVPRPEGPTDLSPGFTLGNHPQSDLGLKGRQKASLAFSAAPSGLDGGEESFPRVNPGLRSVGPLGLGWTPWFRRFRGRPTTGQGNSHQTLTYRATLRLPLRGKGNFEKMCAKILQLTIKMFGEAQARKAGAR
jgi:hypothetical protein